jgi:hypothetical protein
LRETVDIMADSGCNDFIRRNVEWYYQNSLSRIRPIAWLSSSISMEDLMRRVEEVGKQYKWRKMARQLRKCIRKGYYCELFAPKNFLQDLYEIRTSKLIRQGRPIDKECFESVEEMAKSYTNEDNPFGRCICLLHYYVWIGVFTKEKKLVGYVSFVRLGEFSYYSTILGHGDYLKDGIMYYLHFYIQSLLRESNDEHFRDIKGTAYLTWHSGTKGLTFWKQHAGFLPDRLTFINRKFHNTVRNGARGPHP